MNINGGLIKVDVSPNDIVQRLKETIQKTQNIQMTQYQLVANNQILDNSKTLIDNGLRNGDVIDLIPLNQGPKFIFRQKFMLILIQLSLLMTFIKLRFRSDTYSRISCIR